MRRNRSISRSAGNLSSAAFGSNYSVRSARSYASSFGSNYRDDWDGCTHWGAHIQPPSLDFRISFDQGKPSACWVCLSCYQISSNGEVARQHSIEKNHNIVAELPSGDFFCFSCSSSEVRMTRKGRLIYALLTSDSETSFFQVLDTFREYVPSKEDFESFDDMPANLKNILGSRDGLNLENFCARWLQGNFGKKVVVMAGAGISVSAGIPDFRSPKTGIYANLGEFGDQLEKPEDLFTIDFFRKNPIPFYSFVKRLWPGDESPSPTPTHKFIRLLADKRILQRVYTQNIDGLESAAGIPETLIVQAHGSFNSAGCATCSASFDVQELRDKIFQNEVPVRCIKCPQGFIKPGIVFFGEPTAAFSHRSDFDQCDLLIIMGTSLQVSPFAGLPRSVAAVCPRLLLNREKLERSGLDFDSPVAYRDIFVQGDCDESVKKLVNLLGWCPDSESLCLSNSAIPSNIFAVSGPHIFLPPNKLGSFFLAPLHKSHASRLFEAFDGGRDCISKFIDVKFSSEQEAERAIEIWNEESSIGKALHLGIFHAHEAGLTIAGHIRGDIRFESPDDSKQCIYVEYWLNPSFTGAGLMTHAVISFLNRASEINAHITFAKIVCHPDNIASQGVADRLGFIRESVTQHDHALLYRLRYTLNLDACWLRRSETHVKLYLARRNNGSVTIQRMTSTLTEIPLAHSQISYFMNSLICVIYQSKQVVISYGTTTFQFPDPHILRVTVWDMHANVSYDDSCTDLDIFADFLLSTDSQKLNLISTSGSMKSHTSDCFCFHSRDSGTVEVSARRKNSNVDTSKICEPLLSSFEIRYVESHEDIIDTKTFCKAKTWLGDPNNIVVGVYRNRILSGLIKCTLHRGITGDWMKLDYICSDDEPHIMCGAISAFVRFILHNNRFNLKPEEAWIFSDLTSTTAELHRLIAKSLGFCEVITFDKRGLKKRSARTAWRLTLKPNLELSCSIQPEYQERDRDRIQQLKTEIDDINQRFLSAKSSCGGDFRRTWELEDSLNNLNSQLSEAQSHSDNITSVNRFLSDQFLNSTKLIKNNNLLGSSRLLDIEILNAPDRSHVMWVVNIPLLRI